MTDFKFTKTNTANASIKTDKVLSKNNSNSQIMTLIDSTPTWRGLYEIQGNASIKQQVFVHIGNTFEDSKRYVSATYLRFREAQNEMGDFEIHLSGVTSDDYYNYLREGYKVWFVYGGSRLFKGRIEKMERESYRKCKILGKDMSILGKDAQTDRTVYSNTNTSDIVSTEIAKLPTLGLGINTNYGEVTVRNEYGTILGFLSNMVDAIGYDWWISQDSSDNDIFNVDVHKGSGVSKKTYYISKPNSNAKSSNYIRDRGNLYNVVTVLGRGDGVNQVRCKTYNASSIYSSLSESISENDAVIPVKDISIFPPSGGEVRISEERIFYTGVYQNSLTGCIRGYNGTIANPHRKGAFIEMYVDESNAEQGSSIYEYGRKSKTIALRDILPDGGNNQPNWSQTAELIASEGLRNHKDIIQSITIYPSSRNDINLIYKGDTVKVIDDSVGLNQEFIVVEKQYTYDMLKGKIELKYVLSTKSMNLIRQMQEDKKKEDNIQNFMQGSTNIYAINEAENCGLNHYLDIRFYIPPQAVAINRVNINFKLKNFRGYTQTTADESEHTHGIPSLTVASHTHPIPSLTVYGTTTSSTTSGSATPAGASGVSVWGTLNDSGPDVSAGHVQELIVDTSNTVLYTSKYQAACSNFSGYSRPINLFLYFISGNHTNSGDVSLNDGSVFYMPTGESNYTTSGWFYALDYYSNATTVRGTADLVYTHTHGPHSHTIPSLSVNSTSTASSTSGSSGSTVNSSTTTAGSAHNHAMNFGIFESIETNKSVDVYVGEDGGTMSLVGTYTSDQTNIDITDIVGDIGQGKWVDVQFRPNKNMRIEANTYIQIFIESI